MQLTVRMPEEYREELERLSRRLGLRRSDIVRIALKRFLEESPWGPDQRPFEKVGHLLGVAESGVKDLGQRHREHLAQKIRRGA